MAATVEFVGREKPCVSPSILSFKDLELEEDAKKAAEACRRALCRLISPQLLGIEAFNHDHF